MVCLVVLHNNSVGQMMYSSPQPMNIQHSAPAAADVVAVAARATAEAASHHKILKSPFVGTFYESSNPGAEPFVRVGKRVKKGDTLCIIEAMKLMNGIESEFDGVIVKVLARNGEPVEFDQSLFVIEP